MEGEEGGEEEEEEAEREGSSDEAEEEVASEGDRTEVELYIVLEDLCDASASMTALIVCTCSRRQREGKKGKRRTGQGGMRRKNCLNESIYLFYS